MQLPYPIGPFFNRGPRARARKTNVLVLHLVVAALALLGTR
jgi:hypothetical protein